MNDNKRKLHKAGYLPHAWTHILKHTRAIQRNGRNENEREREEKVYSVMDDIFSKIERLSKVLKRESVELDLRSLQSEFHSCTPVKQIECDLMVEWIVGTEKNLHVYEYYICGMMNLF